MLLNGKYSNSIMTLLIVLFSTFIVMISGQDESIELRQSKECVRNDENCNSCMRAGDFCYWCNDVSFQFGSKPHCNTKDLLIKSGCPANSIIGKQKTYSFINEDKPLNDLSTENTSTATQIKPQRVSLEINPGDTHSITFEYRLAKNYPLDLYYLMDLTWSMKDDKETLVKLKNDLPIALKKLTNNFKLGFGSFADKPVMPYSSMKPKHRMNPCSPESGVCEPTYTYKHRMSLTDQVDRFVTIINETDVTGNIDNLEATLEALMQVLVCKDQIGWSADSRKIVILATDGLMHTAGMGLLGGVVRRNDELCHLNSEGQYMESLSMDYPSLSQIDRILSDKKINVIFAVTEDVKHHYDKLNELLPDTTYVGKLESDSSNVLNLVRQGYEDFSSVISFSDDADTDMFDIKYWSDCGTGTLQETSKCEGVSIGETYKFTVNITLKNCNQKTGSITISESQISNQKLRIDLELRCNCECSTPENAQNVCPNNSDIECGKCVCRDGWVGPNCDCNINSIDNENANRDYCRKEMGGLVCSGAGDCLCETCFCDPGFSGSFCECKECLRDLKSGTMCGGPERGFCSCGECHCVPGYEGPTCSCPTAVEACILPGDDKPCSGRGDCRCGECVCRRDGNDIFAGQFCDICTNCENPGCRLYEECAKSTLVDLSRRAVDCVSTSGAIYTPLYKDKPVPDENLSNRCYLNVEKEGKQCKYPFTYSVNTDRTVEIQVYQGSCWGMAETALLALPVFLITLLLGIIIIAVWRCVTYFKDKKEWAQFVAERDMMLQAMSQESDNPLYKSPITKYELPDKYKQHKSSRQDITDTN